MKTGRENFRILKKILLWTPVNKNRKPRYIILSVLLLSSIWLVCFGYLKIAKPVYRSEWTLILPGKGVGANINLVDIGQTSTASASPYSNTSTSPKANYKAFAMSEVVLRMAAKSMNLSIHQFGKPRVKLVDQTSLLYFSIHGSSPEIAQEKAKALHTALLALLNKLRQDELNKQEESALTSLNSFKKKLELASHTLINFQAESNLVSMVQFNEVVLTIEQLRRERINSLATLKELEAKTRRLQLNLGISARQASDSLVLQNDRTFQEGVEVFTKAQQQLLVNQSKWGGGHPEVIKARTHFEQVDFTLKKRFSQLVSSSTKKYRTLLSLKGDSTRNQLLQDLIEYDVLAHGLKRKVIELDLLIVKLVKERNQLTIPAARLDELIREHQVAEAIFTSALARTDTSRTDIYVSYPLVQVLDKPNLPESPGSPAKIFVLAGGFICSILTITGLFLLWKRKPYIRKILKSV